MQWKMDELVHMDPEPADKFSKYRKKQTRNNNAILIIQDMSYSQENYNEIVIFRLYFKDIIRQSNDVFEIKTKYHNFVVILLILTHILSYQDGIIVPSFFLPVFVHVGYCVLWGRKTGLGLNCFDDQRQKKTFFFRHFKVNLLPSFDFKFDRVSFSFCLQLVPQVFVMAKHSTIRRVKRKFYGNQQEI